jgi:hypothetical protein
VSDVCAQWPSFVVMQPAQNLNIHGVFLHVLGDAMGSIAVIIRCFGPCRCVIDRLSCSRVPGCCCCSALFIEYSSYQHRVLADPICSIIISIFILASGVPLGLLAIDRVPRLEHLLILPFSVKQCISMLLHRVPKNINLKAWPFLVVLNFFFTFCSGGV